MRLDVALTPALLRRAEETVAIVVDVLRASSVCVTLFDRGIESIAVAPDPATAMTLRSQVLPQALLCGEIGGLPPDGFDYGNSPVEFSRLDLRGRQAILSTSNGTRALHALVRTPEVFVGCLLNRSAVCLKAFAVARRLGTGITVVCAGNDLGTAFSLDDCFTAGALVAFLQSCQDGEESEPAFILTDAARAAFQLYDAYRGDALTAFREALHGRALEELGFAADLARCSEMDRS
ncbi:MAG: 2-phosphosulfolactate phosphatase, partial [Dehalococcoidia bacterium]